MWTENVQVGDAARRYGIDRRTITAVYNKLRSLASSWLRADPVRLGGPGVICQIDESLFCHKQKYGRGRAPETEKWVFGICDTRYQPAKFYLEKVDNRSAATLLPIIQRVCRPGTIIHSDKWGAYNELTRSTGLGHDTVNHTLHFVDPVTGVHTQNIESCWAQRKAKIAAMKGVRSEQLSGILDEFVWKDKARRNILAYIIEMLTIQ